MVVLENYWHWGFLKLFDHLTGRTGEVYCLHIKVEWNPCFHYTFKLLSSICVQFGLTHHIIWAELGWDGVVVKRTEKKWGVRCFLQCDCMSVQGHSWFTMGLWGLTMDCMIGFLCTSKHSHSSCEFVSMLHQSQQCMENESMIWGHMLSLLNIIQLTNKADQCWVDFRCLCGRHSDIWV